jgi:hypothetical protein
MAPGMKSFICVGICIVEEAVFIGNIDLVAHLIGHVEDNATQTSDWCMCHSST